MKEYRVRITTVEDVKKFVNAVAHFDYEIDLVSGRYAVDAKSIMGIFSIDLEKELKLTAHSDDTEALEEVLADFIIK